MNNSVKKNIGLCIVLFILLFNHSIISQTIDVKKKTRNNDDLSFYNIKKILNKKLVKKKGEFLLYENRISMNIKDEKKDFIIEVVAINYSKDILSSHQLISISNNIIFLTFLNIAKMDNKEVTLKEYTENVKLYPSTNDSAPSDMTIKLYYSEYGVRIETQDANSTDIYKNYINWETIFNIESKSSKNKS